MNIIQMRGRILTKVVVMFMATILAVSAQATDGTWTSLAGGAWSTTGNWAGSAVADGTNAVADFSTLNITADAVVNSDAPRTVGTLRFGDTTPSHNWELTNSTLTLATSSGVPTIDVSNGSVTIGAALQGTQGLYKTGAGQLFISQRVPEGGIGSNTYSGGTYILAGTLMFGGNNWVQGMIGPGTVYLGDSSGSANAVLQPSYTFQNLNNDIVVQSGNTGIMQINNNGGSLNLLGTITLGSSGGTGKSLTLGTVTQNHWLSLYVTGAIQDPINMTPGTAGTLTIDHPDGVRFRAANTYSGPTVILSGSLIQEIANAVPAASAVTVNSGGTFDLNGRNGSIGSLAGSGTVNLNVNTLTVGNDNTSTTFSGIIANAGSLTKIGSGTLTLAGKNTYTGATWVNAGKLLGGTGGNCSKSSVVVAAGATNGVKAMVYGAEGSFVCSNVTYMGDSGLDFDMTTLPVNAGVVPLIINGDLTVTGVVQVSVRNGYWPATGTYPLVRYSGNLSGSGSFNLASLPAGMSATLVNNTGAKRLELDVTAIPAVVFPVSVWTNNVGGMWGTAANWDGGTIADGTNVVADFSTLDLTANASVNNDAPHTVGQLRFGDTSPSHNWELLNSTLTLATSLGLPTIHVSNGSVTIGAALKGTQGLFKTGAGQLNIDPKIGHDSSGSNTYSGGTYILAGTLMFGSGNNNTGLIGPGTVYLGDSSGSANAVLQPNYAFQNLNNNIIVQSGNTGIMQINNNGGSLGLWGTITLGSYGATGKSLTFGRVDGTFVSLYAQGTIQDPINMTPGTAGTVTINHINGVRFRAANTYSGPTVILSGWLIQEIANAVPAASAVTVNSGCGFDLAGYNGSIGSLAGSGTVNLNVNTLTVGNDNTSTTFSGIIANAGSLIKTGSGTLTLAGTSTYSGTTAISNGTLAVSGALSSSGVTVGTGAAFAAGSTGVVGSATLAGTLTFQNNSALLVDVEAASVDAVVAAGDVVIGTGVEVRLSGSQEKSGSWELIKTTTGTVTGDPDLVSGLNGAKLSRTDTAIVLTIPPKGTLIRIF